jgi:hypothetical protein
MAGLAALTAVFLVLGAARSHDTRAGSYAAVLAGFAERRGKDGGSVQSSGACCPNLAGKTQGPTD